MNDAPTHAWQAWETLHALQTLQTRAFGSAAADLDVAFNATDRASTVTALLAACFSDPQGQPLPADAVWGWTLNRRLHALIALRLAAADENTALELQALCAHCGEAMELDLDLLALPSSPAAPHFAWRSESGAELQLRLPRGRDVQRWMLEGAQSQQAIALSLVESLDGEAPSPALPAEWLPAEWLPAIASAFEEADPLTALRLQTRCPECGHDNAVDCDLEALLLAAFKRRQAALLDEVLQLASAFHWTEADIVALPAWRRAHYLRQLQTRGWA